MPEAIYLDHLIAPLAPMLADPDVTDVFINRPGEIFVERRDGAIERCEIGELDGRKLERLARQIAARGSQGVSRRHPLLSTSLGAKIRVQVAMPPVTMDYPIYAFRKQAMSGMTLADHQSGGGFQNVVTAGARADETSRIRAMARKGQYAECLAQAVRSRRNILVSGGTSSGKTTFLNSLVAEIPIEERLVVIEDTAELEYRHANAVRLLAVRGSLGEADVSAEDLLIASLRLRPDRILLGEVRGTEAFSFLRAINTGHPGSMTTIHADSPQRAIDQLTMLVMHSGSRMRFEDVQTYVRSVIDIYVQLDRRGGKRMVSELRFADELDANCEEQAANA